MRPIGIALGNFQSRSLMIGPHGGVAISPPFGIAGYRLRAGPESRQRDQMIHGVIVKESRLNGRPPFRSLATAMVVTIVGGVTQGVGNRGWLIKRLTVH